MFRKALPLMLLLALVSCLNWNYLGRLWTLISSAALNMASGRVVSTEALQSELNDFSLEKLIRLDISDFDIKDIFEQSPEE